MLFYLHGNIESWAITFLIFLIIFIPAIIVILPFLIAHFFFKSKENQANKDKNS
jgi:heme/copper-type cytochrome/quinol oxidase subunit 2